MTPRSVRSGVDAYMDLTHQWAAARAEWERTYYALTAENERGRALVGRLFEHPREHAESDEWEQALAELRAWSMAAWEPASDEEGRP